MWSVWEPYPTRNSIFVLSLPLRRCFPGGVPDDVLVLRTGRRCRDDRAALAAHIPTASLSDMIVQFTQTTAVVERRSAAIRPAFDVIQVSDRGVAVGFGAAVAV